YRGPLNQLWQVKLEEQEDAEPIFVGEEALADADIINYLDQQSSLEDLQHAVVKTVALQSATAILAGGSEITLEWDGLKWARSFINDERQGSAPKSAFSILAPGMHIQVRKLEDKWRL